jgi:hypothetical protein
VGILDVSWRYLNIDVDFFPEPNIDGDVNDGWQVERD